MAKTVAYVFGAILTLVGILGFFNNPVLGLFPVNTLHNVVHLVSGLLLLAGAMMWLGNARMMLIILGVLYAIVSVLGFVMPETLMSLLMSDMTDMWLHVVLAVVFLVAGFMQKSENEMMDAPMSSSM